MANKNPSPATRFGAERGNPTVPPTGRTKGSRDALTKAFIDDLTEVYRQHGKAVLLHVALNDQATMAKLMFALLPKEVEISTPESKLTDEQLEQIHQMLLAGLPVPEAVEETTTVN